MIRCPRCLSNLLWPETDSDAGRAYVCGSCGGSLNVLPGDPPHDAPYVRNTDSILLSQRRRIALATSMTATDLTNLGTGQLRLVGPFATTIAALSNHVGHVVLGSPKKQMGRVDTPRIVATGAVVKHPKPIGNRAVRQNPSHAVGRILSAHSDAKAAIPTLSQARSPEPTSSGAFYIAPEPSRHISAFASIPASLGAINLPPTGGAAKRRAAMGAHGVARALSMMASDETCWLARYLPMSTVRSRGDRGTLAAAALAQPKGNRGILRMHGSLASCATVGDASTSPDLFAW